MLEGEILIILRVGGCKALEVVRVPWSPWVASAFPGWWWPKAGSGECPLDVSVWMQERGALCPGVPLTWRSGSTTALRSWEFLALIKMRAAFRVVTLWKWLEDVSLFNLGASGGSEGGGRYPWKLILRTKLTAFCHCCFLLGWNAEGLLQPRHTAI